VSGLKQPTVMSKLFFIVVVLWGAGCVEPDDTDSSVEYFSSDEFEALGLPFSEAVRVGNTLYLSGQIGNLPGTFDLIPGGVVPETEQTLKNIASVLDRCGSGMDRVVKCTVFLVDIDEWPAVNAVYRKYFDTPFPARSAVAGTGLAIGARVEIECIATVD
jgi:2-iminobutanoate/2-iminopropanoate deaminase